MRRIKTIWLRVRRALAAAWRNWPFGRYDVALVGGAACFGYGLWLWWAPAGFMAWGAFGVAIGALGLSAGKRDE